MRASVVGRLVGPHLVLAFACGGIPAFGQSPLTVGTATARPGETASGTIAVPAGVDPGTELPVSVVNGAAPGPILALVAGTHGYEYTSVVALPRLLDRLDPKRMKGAVILVHMANPPAFYERRIYRNADGKNLNRVYPGKADGTQTERIAFAVTREVIDRATHLIDMHCGDGNEWLWRYSYWQITGDARMDAAGKELALAFGFDHVVVDRERPKDPAKSLYTANTAVLRGKPAITVESGGLGATDEASVGAQEIGALSVISHLGIQAFPSARVEKPLFIDRSEVLTAPATGLWRWAVEVRQSVAAGTLLGRVHDAFGKVLGEVRAPFGGEVLYVVATPPVTKGEPVAYVGQLSETDPKP
ncbi:MAG TPA: succinylglutamate desuccinylase/aspartoacylase family protein [Vicinamibacteria bacterium]